MVALGLVSVEVVEVVGDQRQGHDWGLHKQRMTLFQPILNATQQFRVTVPSAAARACNRQCSEASILPCPAAVPKVEDAQPLFCKDPCDSRSRLVFLKRLAAFFFR